MHISWPRNVSGSSTAAGLLSFFNLAREQWAPLTKGIVKYSSCWHRFRTLALEPNLSWRLHPWPPIGESIDSHYSGLLGWAISNTHLSLLSLLLGLQNPKPSSDIFQPLYHYDNLPTLHLASRKGDAEMVRLLLPLCEPDKTDNESRTALHHAAQIAFAVLCPGKNHSVICP